MLCYLFNSVYPAPSPASLNQSKTETLFEIFCDFCCTILIDMKRLKNDFQSLGKHVNKPFSNM